MSFEIDKENITVFLDRIQRQFAGLERSNPEACLAQEMSCQFQCADVNIYYNNPVCHLTDPLCIAVML